MNASQLYQKAQSAVQAGAAKLFKGNASTSSSRCEATHLSGLSAEHRQTMDGLLKIVPLAKDQLAQTLEGVRGLDATGVANLLDKATAFLRREDSQRLLSDLVNQYGDVLKSSENLQAVSAYVACVLGGMDPAIKAVVVAGVNMLLALAALATTNSEVRALAVDFAKKFQAQVVRPNAAVVQVNAASANAARTNAVNSDAAPAPAPAPPAPQVRSASQVRPASPYGTAGGASKNKSKSKSKKSKKATTSPKKARSSKSGKKSSPTKTKRRV